MYTRYWVHTLHTLPEAWRATASDLFRTRSTFLCVRHKKIGTRYDIYCEAFSCDGREGSSKALALPKKNR